MRLFLQSLTTRNIFADAFHALRQHRYRIGIGKAHVLFRLVHAEIGAGRNRHARGLQQIARKCKTVFRQRAAVRLYIERAGRHDRDTKSEFTQSRHQKIASCFELGTALFKYRQRCRFESCKRRMLRGRRRRQNCRAT